MTVNIRDISRNPKCFKSSTYYFIKNPSEINISNPSEIGSIRELIIEIGSIRELINLSNPSVIQLIYQIIQRFD